MTISRRHLLTAAGAGTMFSAPALAAWPERAIRIISPYNAGGVNDILARGLSVPMSGILKQSVVVENRAGAGGGIGAAVAARSAPDGYTAFLANVDTQAINQFIYRNLPYDPEKDFSPVTLVTTIPFAIVVGPSRPNIRDLPGLIAAAKADPNGLSFCSWGVGSTSHLAFERVARHVGMELLHVPFTSQAPAMQAIMASQVDVMAVPAGGAEAMARDGQTRILAVVEAERLALLPNVPTVKEFGIDLTIGLWQALYMPARTPQPVVAQFRAAAHEAMQTPGFQEVLRGQAAKAEPTTPEGLTELERRERPAWSAIVRQLDIRIE